MWERLFDRGRFSSDLGLLPHESFDEVRGLVDLANASFIVTRKRKVAKDLGHAQRGIASLDGVPDRDLNIVRE